MTEHDPDEGGAARVAPTAPAEISSAASGHRLLPHTADCIIEAWAGDLVSCVTEALNALVESFVRVPDAAATRVLPLAAAGDGPEDLLVSLLEDIIYTLDVFALVPVRFHLADAEGGGIAGDMEVVGVPEVEVAGPAPKAVSYHELSVAPFEGGWRCHVLIDV